MEQLKLFDVEIQIDCPTETEFIRSLIALIYDQFPRNLRNMTLYLEGFEVRIVNLNKED